MVLTKLEQDFFWEIDYIKQIKKNTNEVDKSLLEIKEELTNTFESQQIIISQIQQLFEKQYWSWWNDKFTVLKNKLIQSMENIWIKIDYNRWKIWNIKEYTKKTLSLIRSFYDKTTKDSLTWLWNSEFINNLINIMWEDKKDFCLIYLDLNDLKKINDIYWHEVWDIAIKKFAELLKLIFWEWSNFIARLHWDEFNIVSLESKEKIYTKLEKLDTWLDNRPIKIGKNKKIKLNVAWWYSFSKESNSIAELVKKSDKNMYKNKLIKKNNSFIQKSFI